MTQIVPQMLPAHDQISEDTKPLEARDPAVLGIEIRGSMSIVN